MDAAAMIDPGLMLSAAPSAGPHPTGGLARGSATGRGGDAPASAGDDFLATLRALLDGTGTHDDAEVVGDDPDPDPSATPDGEDPSVAGWLTGLGRFAPAPADGAAPGGGRGPVAGSSDAEVAEGSDPGPSTPSAAGPGGAAVPGSGADSAALADGGAGDLLTDADGLAPGSATDEAPTDGAEPAGTPAGPASGDDAVGAGAGGTAAAAATAAAERAGAGRDGADRAGSIAGTGSDPAAGRLAADAGHRAADGGRLAADTDGPEDAALALDAARTTGPAADADDGRPLAGADPASRVSRPVPSAAGGEAAAPETSAAPADATASRPAAGARDAQLSPAIARVLDALAELEHAPPPRRLTLDLGDVRVRVAVEDGGVRLTVVGGDRAAGDALTDEAAEALLARGFDLAGDRSGGDRDGRPGSQDPASAAPGSDARRRGGRSGAATDGALRL
jgi:hypothetical protein